MVNFLLGQRGGYTKYLFFSCYWDSGAYKVHWVRKQWPSRNTMKPGEKNKHIPLIDQKNIIQSPLHIKLGLMKQFVRALGRLRDCFGGVCSTFPGLNYDKNKAGVLDGPQIRTLLKYHHFKTAMTTIEPRAWNAFADVIHNFPKQQES